MVIRLDARTEEPTIQEIIYEINKVKDQKKFIMLEKLLCNEEKIREFLNNNEIIKQIIDPNVTLPK